MGVTVSQLCSSGTAHNPSRRRWWVVSLILQISLAGVAYGQIPALPEVPADLADRHPDLLRQKNGLQGERQSLRTLSASHNSECRSVEQGSAAESRCKARLEDIQRYVGQHIDATNRFIKALQEARREPVDGYIPYGEGVIGGTSWIVGHNLPRGSSEEMRTRAMEMFKQQVELAGLPYNTAIDFSNVEFVLGIAASTATIRDLGTRVFFDHLKNGGYSRETQAGYNSLKGRSFEKLHCHSNGAMICLAAISNKDAKAAHVHLYGPQITDVSLQAWEQAIRSGLVRSVEVHLNKGDPVPPISMLQSPGLIFLQGGVTQGLAFFIPRVLETAIHTHSPSIRVRNYECTAGLPTLNCHDMRLYKFNSSGCKETSSGRVVPGTAGVLEPPAPCY
jgi:hypothetical protein